MFNDVQQQYQEDMHGLIDDISMPNQSMTMSNLSAISQSPFRGGIKSNRGGGFNFGAPSSNNGTLQSNHGQT